MSSARFQRWEQLFLNVTSVSNQLTEYKKYEKENHTKTNRRQPIPDGHLKEYVENLTQTMDISSLKLNEKSEGKGRYTGFRLVEKTTDSMYSLEGFPNIVFKLPRKITSDTEEEHNNKLDSLRNSLNTFYRSMGMRDAVASREAREAIEKAQAKQLTARTQSRSPERRKVSQKTKKATRSTSPKRNRKTMPKRTTSDKDKVAKPARSSASPKARTKSMSESPKRMNTSRSQTTPKTSNRPKNHREDSSSESDSDSD